MVLRGGLVHPEEHRGGRGLPKGVSFIKQLFACWGLLRPKALWLLLRVLCIPGLSTHRGSLEAEAGPGWPLGPQEEWEEAGPQGT